MIALLSLALSAAAPPPSVAFADHLYDTGDYYLAIGEYERYLFEDPAGDAAAHAQIRIGQSYLRGERFPEAAAHFDTIAEQSRDPALRGLARLDAAAARSRGGEQDLAVQELLELVPDPALSPALRDRATYLLGWAYLLGHDPDLAIRTFGAAAASPDWGREARALASEAEGAKRLPHRSPLLAGLLSAVLPGAGYFYLGEPGTGLAAIAWNGLFGFGVYDAAAHRLWGIASVLGVLEAMWYGGAIFGSVSGAHKFDRDAWRNYTDGLEEEHDWRSATVGP